MTMFSCLNESFSLRNERRIGFARNTDNFSYEACVVCVNACLFWDANGMPILGFFRSLSLFESNRTLSKFSSNVSTIRFPLGRIVRTVKVMGTVKQEWCVAKHSEYVQV